MATYFGNQAHTYDDDFGEIVTIFGWYDRTYGHYTCPGSGTQNIQELSAYVSKGAPAVNMRMGVYTSVSSPVLVAEGIGEVAVVGTLAWQGHMTQVSVKAAGGSSPGQLTGGAEYIFAVTVDYAGSSILIGSYTRSANTASMYNTTDNTGGMPSGLSSGTDAGGQEYNLRCGVDPAGVSVTPAGGPSIPYLWAPPYGRGI